MRLIDANALKKQIVDFKVNLHPQNQDYGSGYFSALSVVEGMLAYAPTVDAVPVVRCKECKHRRRYVFPFSDQTYTKCKIWGGIPRPDDFCSYGERKST